MKKTLPLESSDSVKITLTTQENGKAKRPHQAFIVVKEQETGLEAPFALTTKDTGKATVDIVRTAQSPAHCLSCLRSLC